MEWARKTLAKLEILVFTEKTVLSSSFGIKLELKNSRTLIHLGNLGQHRRIISKGKRKRKTGLKV